jgi:hypothetical protein
MNSGTKVPSAGHGGVRRDKQEQFVSITFAFSAEPFFAASDLGRVHLQRVGVRWSVAAKYSELAQSSYWPSSTAYILGQQRGDIRIGSASENFLFILHRSIKSLV